MSAEPPCDRLHNLELKTVQALERIAHHMETSKRGFERIDALDREMIQLTSTVKSLVDFNGRLIKIGLALATGGVMVIWWIVQRWIEHR